MSLANSVSSMSSAPREIVATRADDQTPMNRIGVLPREQRWNDHIRTLLDWLRDPNQLSDDGVDPPRQTIIRLALDCAEYLRDRAKCPAPTRIAVDANGGIIFTLAHINDMEEIRFWEDGSVEYLDFVGTQLRIRREFEW